MFCLVLTGCYFGNGAFQELLRKESWGNKVSGSSHPQLFMSWYFPQMIREAGFFCPALKCHLLLITYQGLLSSDPRNAAAQAFEPRLILMHTCTCVKRRWGFGREVVLTPSYGKSMSMLSMWMGNRRLEWSKLSLWPVSAVRLGDERQHCQPRPLERCPQLSGLVSVVVCLFVFRCGHTHTHTHTAHKSDMKRLSDILLFTPFFTI